MKLSHRQTPAAWIVGMLVAQACGGNEPVTSSQDAGKDATTSASDSNAVTDSGDAPTRAWTSVVSPTTDGLFGIWGSGRDDVWAVGGGLSNGTIVHWDGSSWSNVPCPTSGLFSGVWGSGPDDVWAVTFDDSFDGTIEHWDGSAWTNVPSPTTEILESVWERARRRLVGRPERSDRALERRRLV